MKRTVFSVFTSLAAIVFLGACEQHSWEETKHLTSRTVITPFTHRGRNMVGTIRTLKKLSTHLKLLVTMRQRKRSTTDPV